MGCPEDVVESNLPADAATRGAPVLVTARLRLRELQSSDSGLMLAVLNDPAFIRHVADRGVRTEAAAREYLEAGPLASYRAHGYGFWRVETHEGEPVGLCGLVKRDALPGPDLGYALLGAHAGKGYATEAAAGVVRHATEVLRVDRLLAIVNPGHSASTNVLGKLGFRPAGTTRLAADAPLLDLFVRDATQPDGGA